MILKYLQLQSFCFVLPLRSGVKLFGFLSLTGSILLLLYAFADLIFELKSPYDSYDVVLGLEWLNVIVQLTQCCTSMTLLIGAYQDKAELFTWWLWSSPLAAILEATLFPSFTRHFFHLPHHTAGYYLLTAITLIDDVYGWLTTFSHYRVIRRQSPSLV